MATNERKFDEVPEDVREVAVRLEMLAARDRAGVWGLEGRVFAATRDLACHGESDRRGLTLVATGTERGHRPRAAEARGTRRLWTPMRLAAAVAIFTAGGAIWLASVMGPGGAVGPGGTAGVASRDAEVDYIVALAGLDDGWDSLNERLDVLKLETDAVAGSLLWELSWGGLLLTEGAAR